MTFIILYSVNLLVSYVYRHNCDVLLPTIKAPSVTASMGPILTEILHALPEING